MTRRILLAFAILILAVGCGVESKKQSRDGISAGNPNTCDTHYEANDINEQVSQDEDYKVYSDLLMQLNPDAKGNGVFVIHQLTNVDFIFRPDNIKAAKDHMKKEFGGYFIYELIEDFFKVNSKQKILQLKFAKGLSVVLVSEKEVNAIFKNIDDGWERFYAKYPRAIGLMGMSVVAFNAEKTKALFYYEEISDFLAGAGYYVLMIKQDDRWVIHEKVRSWIW
jgi:hypothetical protein